jgi:hypothetical protein
MVNLLNSLLSIWPIPSKYDRKGTADENQQPNHHKLSVYYYSFNGDLNRKVIIKISG